MSGGAPGRRVSRGVSLTKLAVFELRLEVGDLDELVVGSLQLTSVLGLRSGEDISLKLVLGRSTSLGYFAYQRVRAFDKEIEDSLGLLVFLASETTLSL